MPNCAEETATFADPRWELALLSAVQAFYLRLLSEHLGGKIPVAAEMAASRLDQAGDLHSALRQADLWIQLLDMALTPAMLRLGLDSGINIEVAEALLRHFARHQDDSSSSRDKADLVATFLFRHPRVPGQWGQRGYALDGSIPLSPFEISILEILPDSGESLPDQHHQALREFGPLLAQAHRFQDFSALIDSGILTRVRELKAALGKSIYSPVVLATLAPYNVAFGDRFQSLFASAVREIKNSARAAEEQGGRILGTIDGIEIEVGHVTALDAEEVLKFDYSAALEKFRRISQLKKELARTPPARRSQPESTVLTSRPAPWFTAGTATAPAHEAAYEPTTITPEALAIEEAKLTRVAESIRVFVRVANPKSRHVVPMRYFNLVLNDDQVEACSSDYLDQASPQAGAARFMLRTLAMNTRIATEMEELKRSLHGGSVWRLHADPLAVLLHLAKAMPEALDRLTAPAFSSVALAANSLHASLENLRARTAEAEKALKSE